MTRQKKILIAILSLLLLVIGLNAGLNYWVASRLPEIISEKNDSPYNITYTDLDFSILNGYIIARNIVVSPKTGQANAAQKTGIYANIEAVEIKHFKLWPLLFSNKIKARSLTISKPKVVLYQKNEKAINDSKSIRSQVVAPFRQIVLVPDVYLNQGQLNIVDAKNSRAILTANNINIKLEGIVITDEILEQKIPFSYDTYAFSCDSLYYRPSVFYHIATHKIETTNKGLTVEKFSMLPEFSRPEFVKIIPKEKDIYTLKAENIAIRDMEWGFKGGKFFFHTKRILLDTVAANIYRPKMPPDDLSKKPLYNKLLRDIPFDLKVDTLAVWNSFLEYEEEKTFEKGAGELTFSNFNLTATHLSSGFGATKLPDVKISVNCNFMKTAPMKVDWTLNVLDKTDGFNIKGSIRHFPAEKLTPFVKPYMNITAKGMLDEVYFNFTGNDKTAKGDFAINYDDLKFTVYKKDDRKKKNKLLTAIAGIFVKKDTKDKVKNTNVELERIPEKSFYNFLWRSIAEGLKKLLV